MIKQLFIVGAMMLAAGTTSAQIFTAKQGGTNISFFSEAPLENIEAVNKSGSSVLNGRTGDFQLKISIINFKFKSALMEEHFNENYMETEKFPYSTFKGKFNEDVSNLPEGDNKVTITGKLEIHGVIKDVTISGVITKKGDLLTLKAKFKVLLSDYKIQVPSMYVKNIAETVDITFETVLEPHKKKE